MFLTYVSVYNKFVNWYRSKEWVVACRRADLMNKTAKYLYGNCKLCSEHFENCMFVNPTVKNRLNDKAKPSIFNVQNPPPNLGRKRRIIARNEAQPSSGKVQNFMQKIVHYNVMS